MDIKDFQEKIDGAIEEIFKLVEKKVEDTSTISETLIINNINHKIKSWDVYVNNYISSGNFNPINKYDIDIINIILYILKYYGKLIVFHCQENTELFMDSFIKYKEDSILYEVIHKINSNYKLNNFNSKKYSNTCNQFIDNIIEFIEENLIHFQIKILVN